MLAADELLSLLRQISSAPKTNRYYADGRRLTGADWSRYEANLNLDAIGESNEVRFGMAVKRANMRTFPTDDRVFKTETHSDLDRFQENALFPADAVAVIQTSRDGEWRLVQSYNYLAWVRSSAIAIGDRAPILQYRNRDDFVVVTGAKVFTNYNPHLPEISELQLDMGVRLALTTQALVGNDLRGQNPYASLTVDLPVRDAAGNLRFEPALIARSNDITRGYLRYTRTNLIRQSFKFLGERYGWGHSYNARDCTGFVSEIYKSFGILLPRNSGDQRRSAIGQNIRFDRSAPVAARIQALDSLDVGNLIYIPGHVMLYLGQVDGEPYVIHDVAGLNYTNPNGEYYNGILSGVSVTPLLPLKVAKNRSYVDSIQSIKQVK